MKEMTPKERIGNMTSQEILAETLLKTCEKELNRTIGFMLTEQEAKMFSNAILSSPDFLSAVIEEKMAGELLFMDLAHRLIKRILEFNPDEHDIELNLCGIIEKAKHSIAQGGVVRRKG